MSLGRPAAAPRRSANRRAPVTRLLHAPRGARTGGAAGPSSGHPAVAAWSLAGAASGLSLGQLARILTALLWLAWSDWWLQQPWVPGSPVIALVLSASAVAVMFLAVLVRDPAGQARLDKALLVGTLVLIAVTGAAGALQTGYGTDELAYEQAAAGKLLHGVNPYNTDFTYSLAQFGVFGHATMTLHGTSVTAIAYPALSFLVYEPFVLLMGEGSYAGILTDLLVWSLAAALLWRLMSASLRPWVPILVALPIISTAIAGGVTDSLYMPFELIAVCCWDRFGDPRETTMARWAGPVALGLACCLKQPPWLIAPFLLAGVSIEAHRRGQDPWRVGLRYVAIAFGVFLVPNLPFIVWGPGAWLSRILLPVTGALMPMGIGPAGMMRAFSIGGGNLSLFSLASGLALIAAVAVFLRHYRYARLVIPLLPLLALFVSTRSFTDYFGMCVPALAVNAASLRPSDSVVVGRRLGGALGKVALGAVAGALAAVGAALLSAAPVRLGVTASHEDTVTLTATVTVQNLSGRSVTPHFIAVKGPTFDQAMDVIDGPSQLPPHSTVSMTVSTPVTPLLPKSGDRFQVQVTTDSPDTVAFSSVSIVGSS